LVGVKGYKDLSEKEKFLKAAEQLKSLEVAPSEEEPLNNQGEPSVLFGESPPISIGGDFNFARRGASSWRKKC